MLGGSGDRRPPGNLKIERSFRSSPHLANRRRRRHLGSGLRPPPPPPSDDDVSSPLADDEDPEPLLPLLSLLPHQRDFFFKPNSNPTRPQHTATKSPVFSRSRSRSSFVCRTASENREIADHSRGQRSNPFTKPCIDKSGRMTSTSHCLCSSHVGHVATVYSTSSSGRRTNIPPSPLCRCAPSTSRTRRDQ